MAKKPESNFAGQPELHFEGVEEITTIPASSHPLLPGFVPGFGPISSKLVVIGEAPGEQEVAQGKPFVGPSGKLLRGWMVEAGINPAEVRFENVYPYRPLDNAIENVGPDEVEYWASKLVERLATFSNAVVLVPLGNTALKAVTGRVGITDWRGSIFDGGPNQLYVIPSLHPAAVLRRPDWTGRCLSDWRKIADQLSRPDRGVPVRSSIVLPTKDDLNWFIREFGEHWAADNAALSIDIETNHKTGDLICVGFSFDPCYGISIRWDTPADKAAIRILCDWPCDKVLQNALYDLYWLHRFDCPVAGEIHDTLGMHHALDARDEHSLAHLASLYTREPYWKHEGKQTSPGVGGGIEALCRYNVKDACVTLEIFSVLEALLQDAGKWNFYLEHYSKLIPPLLTMMLGGIRIDGLAREAQAASCAAELAEIKIKLATLAGEPLHAKIGLSPTKLGTFMYDSLKLRPKYKTPGGAYRTDEVTVRKFINKYPQEFGEAGGLILAHRRQLQLSAFVKEARVNEDGRMYYGYSFNTEAGRLSSSKTPMVEGVNIQNQDRAIRHIFVPDPGHIFIEFDLSQAESRVVYMLSGDVGLQQVAVANSWEYDQHTANAAAIFNIPPEQVTKQQRQIGKIVSHGAQRAMTGMKLQDVLLKEDVILSIEECDKHMQTYFDTHPGILAYFRWVRMQIMANRCLVDPFGRTWECKWDRLDDALYRAAYSFLPQSTVANILQRWGAIPLHDYLADKDARIVNSCYDSVLVSTAPGLAWDIYKFVRASLERPVMLRGKKLTIPVEIKLGSTWKGAVEFKKPPSREEFDLAVAGIQVAQ